MDLEKCETDLKEQSMRPSSAHHKALSRVKPRFFGRLGNAEITASKKIVPVPPTGGSDTCSTSTKYQSSDASGAETCTSTRKTSPVMSLRTHDYPYQHSRKISESSQIYHSHEPELGTTAVRAKKRIKASLE
ncbi:hypothetical protein E4U55_001494 [Claviceps digitariae]|nr:hypothetical protein E4U55_001494 [Claviceps digitariae]